jgi:hypothetical protein
MDHIHPYFPRNVPVLWVIESSVSVSQIFGLGSQMSLLLDVLKYSLADNAHEGYVFPMVEENICKDRTECRLRHVGAPGRLVIGQSARRIFF